jgi:hypothetical protein
MSISLDLSEHNRWSLNILLASGSFMKIDTPLTTDLGLGASRRIIDPADSVVDIPSAVMPVLDIIQPTSLGGFLTTTVQTQSFITNDIRFLNNQAAVTNNVIATLGLGLWSIQFTGALFTNIATALTTNSQITYVLSNGTFNPFILAATLQVGQAGTSLQGNLQRVLLRDQTVIAFSAPLTAAGDTIFLLMSLNCQKAL